MKQDTCEIIIVLNFNLSDDQMSQVSIEEREVIMKRLAQWKSKRSIARELGRSPNTVCEEIKRNTWRWEYSAQKAEHKAYVRRLYAKKNLKKIRCNDEMENYIREKVKDDWSPELVAWKRNKEHRDKISTPTVYKYVYSRFGYDLLEHLYSRRNWRRRRKVNPNKSWGIKYRKFIDVRPENISKLLEFGHREADLIVGPQWSKPVLLVLIEKTTRWKIAKKLPDKRAETVEKILESRVEILGIKSITFDNWLEFANHYKLWIHTYFSHPYHSREKAQVERWNRDYRRFFPKWTDRKKISQKEIDKITDKLNNMPMKVLKFKTPNEVFKSHYKNFSQVSCLTL